MKTQGNQLYVTDRFLKEVSELIAYLEKHSDRAAEIFFKDMDEFIFNRIAKYPKSFPEFKWKPTPNKIYRSALFKKKYYLVYRFEGNEIEFVLFYHHKRDPSNLDL